MKRFFLFIILIITFFYLYIAYLGIKGLSIKEYTIEDELIPNSYNGFTIAHFSDLLYGSINNTDDLKSIVNQINEYNPDIIVFTGNLISPEITLSEKEQKEIIDLLNTLEAQQKKFAIYGEDDKENLEQFKKIIDGANFKILDNSYELVFKNNNSPLLLMGVTSFENLDKNSLNDTIPFMKIALISRSDDADNLINDNIDVIFAGNSLGGLVKIPFFGGILKQQGSIKYLEGEYDLNNKTSLFVSTGLGTRKMHYRGFNKPSINIYKLYSKNH